MKQGHVNLTEKINEAVELLCQASRPLKIILFGSVARGDAEATSDLDLLVVQKKVSDRLQEIVRLRRVLRPIRLPIDLLVISEKDFQYWKDTPGSLYFEINAEGKVIYEEEAA